MTQQPALFISHGAPTLAIEASPAQSYLKELGHHLERPRAIIVISAHHVCRGVAVTSDPQPETIHDFAGFPSSLYEITYPAPGAPDLAADIVDLLAISGLEARLQTRRGFDHGAWVPLSLVFPQADVPVVQLSIDMSESPLGHYRLGQALAPLRNRNILIVGSGGATHNLGAFFHGDYEHDSPPPAWVSTFADWIAARIAAGEVEAVLEAVESGPFGSRNHPSMDHIHPLFVAMGAGAGSPAAARIHQSTTYGVLAMDVYGFGEPGQIERLATTQEPAGHERPVRDTAAFEAPA
ncbi:MAG: dioxygenase [Alphaproteobacteria bacterium]|nr:dioxygenase [Alphaproteobacteria bacterium]